MASRERQGTGPEPVGQLEPDEGNAQLAVAYDQSQNEQATDTSLLEVSIFLCKTPIRFQSYNRDPCRPNNIKICRFKAIR